MTFILVMTVYAVASKSHSCANRIAPLLLQKTSAGLCNSHSYEKRLLLVITWARLQCRSWKKLPEFCTTLCVQLENLHLVLQLLLQLVLHCLSLCKQLGSSPVSMCLLASADPTKILPATYSARSSIIRVDIITKSDIPLGALKDVKKANSALINCLSLWRRDFFIGQHLSISPRLHQLALSQNGFLRVILQIIWSSQQSLW